MSGGCATPGDVSGRGAASRSIGIEISRSPMDGWAMRDGRRQHYQAYPWQYGTPGDKVDFDFRLGRELRDRSSFWASSMPPADNRLCRLQGRAANGTGAKITYNPSVNSQRIPFPFPCYCLL